MTPSARRITPCMVSSCFYSLSIIHGPTADVGGTLLSRIPPLPHVFPALSLFSFLLLDDFATSARLTSHYYFLLLSPSLSHSRSHSYSCMLSLYLTLKLGNPLSRFLSHPHHGLSGTLVIIRSYLLHLVLLFLFWGTANFLLSVLRTVLCQQCPDPPLTFDYPTTLRMNGSFLEML